MVMLDSLAALCRVDPPPSTNPQHQVNMVRALKSIGVSQRLEGLLL